MRAVRPSPARIAAPEPDVWLPILLALEDETREARFAPPLVDLPPVRVLRPASPRAPGMAEPAPGPAPDPAERPVRVPAPPASRARPSTRGHTWHALILGVSLAVVAAGLPYFLRAPAQRRVTLRVDGVTATHTTRAADVGAFLAAAGLDLGPGDEVAPRLGAPLAEDTTVTVRRARPVTVDVDGVVREVRTSAHTVRALRRQLRIPDTLVAVSPRARISRGATIVFRTPHDVRLIVDGVEGVLTSTAATVGALLAERDVAYRPGDQIEPAPQTPLHAGLAITVTHTTADRVVEEHAVPFGTEERPDPALPQGLRRVIQAGVAGAERTTYQLTRAGDAVLDRQPLGIVRVRDPQPEIVAVGAMPVGGAHRQSGTATWYATLYQPGTCAHLHAPFGTTVRVVNTATGAAATCRVADRGPEAWTGHVIDLSPDVFDRIGSRRAGVLHVRLEY